MHRYFLMALFLPMAWFLIVPTITVAQPLDWQKYASPETGASVDLPATIFSKDAGPTEQGHGRRFTT